MEEWLFVSFYAGPRSTSTERASRLGHMQAGHRFGSVRAAGAGVALLLGTAAPSAVADSRWVRARTDHFDLLTNTTATEARQAAAALEQFRRVLERLLPPARPGLAGAPVVVLAFRDDATFDPFVPLHDGEPRAADGFFQ